MTKSKTMMKINQRPLIKKFTYNANANGNTTQIRLNISHAF